MRRIIFVAAMAAFLLVPVVASPVGSAPAEPFPDSIDLPTDFFPEGIAIDGRTAYVGSLAGGAIQRQNIVTGESEQFAPSPGPAQLAVGMDVDDRGRLWVATGGPVLTPFTTSGFRVYDTATGALLLDQPVPAGFVNDVIVTDDAAWFTDSFAPALIRVPIADDGSIGPAETVPLQGDWDQVAGDFNANGIVATADQKHLIVAQATSPDGPGAALYRVPADAEAPVLDASRIELDATLAAADGLVLIGRTLYSVAQEAGVVKLKLSQGLASARIVDTLDVPGSVTPTTAAAFGSSLYVVDANFPLLFGRASGVPFQTTRIPR